ncbi:MAG: DUF2878 domain-containing protein [Luteimonas sp.]
MHRWLNAIGYQAVWLCAVIGAGRGIWWSGPAAAAVFVAWQFALSRHRAADARLLIVALVCGLILDSVLAATGWARYGAAWPSAAFAPAWILSVWVSFAMTLTQSMRFLHGRRLLALLLGAIGGPLAYLGASHGWAAVVFTAPRWHAIAWLAVAWALAMPLLAGLAARWARPVHSDVLG